MHADVKVVAKADDRTEVLDVAGQDLAIAVEEQLSLLRRKHVAVGCQVGGVVLTSRGWGIAAPSKMVLDSRICNWLIRRVAVRGAVVVGRRLNTLFGRKNLEGFAVQNAAGG